MFEKFECETAVKFWGDADTAGKSLWARLWTRASGTKCDIFPYLIYATVRVKDGHLSVELSSRHARDSFVEHVEWIHETMKEWLKESGKQIGSFSIEHEDERIFLWDGDS